MITKLKDEEIIEIHQISKMRNEILDCINKIEGKRPNLIIKACLLVMFDCFSTILINEEIDVFKNGVDEENQQLLKEVFIYEVNKLLNNLDFIEENVH